ncbi:MAG: hypothetical protein ACJAZ9_002113 [Neolewinella sp.]|jgi:hypothetical protein
MRLPYFYNLPLALIPTFFISSVSWTVSFGIGSWNMNRTINWGWPGLTPQNYLYVSFALTFIPAFFVAGYFIFQFIKHKEVKLFPAIGILMIMTLLSFALPHLVHP